MSYEGEAFGIIAIPDVEVSGDVADWLLKQANVYSISPGEWVARLVTTVYRMGVSPPLADNARRLKCPGCHIRGELTAQVVLELRAEGIAWRSCAVCHGRFTPAEWAVYNSVFPVEATP